MYTIISGTNRPNSNSKKVASFYQQMMHEEGVEAKLLSLEDLPSDFAFTQLNGESSDEFKQIVNDYIADCQRFIVVVAEYNGSFPGVLKTFIDSVSPEHFQKKRVALVGISAGMAGNLRGLDHLTGVFHYLRAEVLSVKPKLSGIENLLSEQGKLNDTASKELLKAQFDLFKSF